MGKINWYKRLLISFVIFLLPIVIAFSACSPGNSVKINLYDGDTLWRTADVVVGKEYSFGKPDKQGYTFLGWYSAAEGGSAYTDAEGSSAGLTWNEENSTEVFAHWSANTYVITFEYTGATAQNSVSEISVVYDSEISDRFPVPLKSGYAFQGWYTAESGGTQITDSIGNFVESANVYNFDTYPLSGNGTKLYAHWGEKTVTFTFNTDGSAVDNVSYTVGAVLNTLPLTTKDNYCFEAWCLDATFLSPITFPFTIPEHFDSTVPLYAKFTEGTNNVLQFATISSSNDKEYEVSYSGDSEVIVIPDSYYGKAVTRIRSINSETVKTVIMPQGIKEFSVGAFENCVSLEEANIPTAIQIIPEKLFNGCQNLKTLNIPYGVKTIGKSAFAGCASVEELNLGDNVFSIGNGAFRNMSSLKKFTVSSGNERYFAIEEVLYYKVGNSLYLIQYPAAKEGATYDIDSATTRISEGAFSSAMLTSIVLGGKISTIETGAFENCKNLVNVTLNTEAATISIEADAFANCSNLKALKIESNKVPSLGTNAFTGVSSTFSVYVPSSLEKNFKQASNWRNLADSIYSVGSIFGDYAVEEVDGGYAIRQYFGTAAEVVIPEILNAKQIVKISENAFSFSDFERITVSQYIVEIGDRAFSDCTNLSAVIMECVPPVLGGNAFDNIKEDFGIYIKNTTEVLDQYRAADGWSELSNHIWSY